MGTPGAARFLQSVCDDLDAGIAVSLELPNTVDEFDLESGVAGRYPLKLTERVEVAPGQTPVETIASALGIPAQESPGSATGLVRSGRLDDRLLWISGLASLAEDELHEWLDTAEQIAVAADDHGAFVPVVLCVRGDRAALRLPDSPSLRLRRWWDVLGRLDLAVLVTQSAGHVDHVAREEIVELTGDDYSLAAALADASDRRDEWQAICRERASQLNIEDVDIAGVPTRCSFKSARSAWLRGAVCSVDGATVVHAGVLVAQGRDRDLNRRRWASQIRAVLPQLDLLRVALLERAAANGAIAAWRTNADQAEVEFSDVASTLARRTDLSREAALAEWLRGARNDLAHLRALSSEQIGTGHALAERAGLDWPR
jgi:hypothetical protein